MSAKFVFVKTHTQIQSKGKQRDLAILVAYTYERCEIWEVSYTRNDRIDV